MIFFLRGARHLAPVGLNDAYQPVVMPFWLERQCLCLSSPFNFLSAGQIKVNYGPIYMCQTAAATDLITPELMNISCSALKKTVVRFGALISQGVGEKS